jgi:hypothetical protein
MLKQFIFILPILLFSQTPALSSIEIADGFKKPLYIASHPNDATLLYVVEQAGRIMIIQNGKNLKSHSWISKNAWWIQNAQETSGDCWDLLSIQIIEKIENFM